MLTEASRGLLFDGTSRIVAIFSRMIDLRSDTVTRPTPAMRRAMADADVGDDVLDGDPTVRRLEERTAELLGKERALFCPTGTMANQCAIGILARHGTEMLLDADSHIVLFELAGAAALHGVQVRAVESPGGAMDADSLARAIRPPDRDRPRASLVSVENTNNSAGGRVTPIDELRRLRDVARVHGLAVHLDGARLWNASAATGTPVADFAACADTVMVSFSKGLGAPVGAALAGRADAIEEGWVIRRRLGGGMRQSGIIAAGALHGLECHRPRLEEDHELARLLAALLADAGGARVVLPDTNIVMVDLPAGRIADDVVAAAEARGVLIGAWTPTRLRMVTHLDVDRAAVERAGSALRAVLES
jgi:threonine aldolase